jgi:hypothetical protein
VKKIHDEWVISPKDLIAELECNHRLALEWSTLTGLVDAPENEESEELELLAEQGKAHE